MVWAWAIGDHGFVQNLFAVCFFLGQNTDSLARPLLISLILVATCSISLLDWIGFVQEMTSKVFASLLEQNHSCC
jgi:hypothetical protein